MKQRRRRPRPPRAVIRPELRELARQYVATWRPSPAPTPAPLPRAPKPRPAGPSLAELVALERAGRLR